MTDQLDDDPNMDCTDIPAEQQKEMFQKFSDDVMSVRNLIPNKRKEAVDKEIRLRKIVAELSHAGYSKQRIDHIFQQYAGKELFDDIVSQYNSRNVADPDISDLVDE